MLAIVILNWRQPDLTLHCLHSVKVALTQVSMSSTVIVIENGSGDESAEIIRREWVPDGQSRILLVQASNQGYSIGCNIGIQCAMQLNAEYVLLLNNDATLTHHSLAELLCGAQDKRVGIVGAYVQSNLGKSYFRHSSKTMFLFGFAKLSEWIVRREDRLSAWHKTDIVNGSCLLLSRDLINFRLRIKGHVFDPAFFMYYEDVDLCLFARAHQFNVISVQGAIVYHVNSGSSQNESGARVYYYITRNRVFAANRWLTPCLNHIFKPYYLVTRLIQILLLMIGGAFGNARAVFEGIKDAYINRMGKWTWH